MAKEIVPTTKTDTPDVELIYLEDQDVAGINVKGLARLLECHPTTVTKALQGVNDNMVIDAEIQTTGGIQAVNFILEDGVIEVLERLMDGRVKAETKKTASTLYRRFAKAGFKLYAMLNVAPEKLKEQIDRVVEARQVVERALPQRDAVDYANAAKIVTDLPDGILKQLVKDALVDQISLEQNLKYLPVAEKPRQYTIVKVRAKMLGYTEKQIGDGSRLGRFVRAQIEPAFQEMIGKYPTYHYEVSPLLDQAIHQFFA